MSFTLLPPFFNMHYTTSEGKLTPAAHEYNDQLFQGVNNAIGSGYFAITPQTTAQITAALSAAPEGAVWFNSTLGKLQVKTGPSTVETVTST